MNVTTSKSASAFAQGLWVRSQIFVLLCIASLAGTQLHAQATATAESPGQLQIGGTFNYASADYASETLIGGGAYATFDFKYHWGIEAEVHQLNNFNTTTAIYERTYEIGPRYVLHHGRFAPYIKAMYGRGVFNFNYNYPPVDGSPTGGTAANLAYNLGSVGVGVDYRLRNSINLRAEYQYQDWFGFVPNDLTPSLLGVGIAYRFH
jgi:opacity protein-like surface antigen